jgi:SAM-dependent methyltransferase
MTGRSDWEGRTGRKWADEWRRTDRSFAGLTDRLLHRARGEPFKHALDIGCGAGELSLALARDRPDAQIDGIDISEPLVAVARERGSRFANVSFTLADAAGWIPETGSPDLLASRHGVMFFDDPVASFAHLRAIATPHARLLFSSFRHRDENAWASGIAGLLPPEVQSIPAPGSPGPFAFADTGHVESILEAAGWGEIAFEKVDFAYVAGAGRDPVSDALTYFLAIGPAAAAAAELGIAERAAFIERLEEYLGRHRDGSIVALGAAAWLVSARAR